MSLSTAVHESAHEVLREILSPEMSDKLAQAIVEKTQARLEPLITELFGLEGREARRKSAKPRRERSDLEVEAPLEEAVA